MLDVGCEGESTPVGAPGVGGEDRQLGSGPAGDRERDRTATYCQSLAVSLQSECRSVGVSQSVSSPVISL